MAFNRPRYPHLAPASAQVQRQRKATHFTVTTIGGPAELAQWKRDQARREQEWQTAQEKPRADRRQRAIDVLQGSKPAMGLSEMEREELKHREARLRKRAKPVAIVSPAYEPAPEPKVTLLQRVRAWWGRLWANAFPS